MKESLGGLLCAAIAIAPILVILVIWFFFREAVRSGVQGAAPAALPAPPAAAGLTEQAVREIVRDELRRLQAARAAAKPSQASPGSAPPGAAGSPRRA